MLHQEIAWLDDVIRAKKPKKLPVVLSRDEGKRVLQHLEEPTWLMASVLYGSGLRLMECPRLRVKDVDLAMHQLTVREGKGAHNRATMLPDSLREPLQRHLHTVKQLHAVDREAGYGSVYLLYALERKYPDASHDWLWPYVFPVAKRSCDPRSGIERRHHVLPLMLHRPLPLDQLVTDALRQLEQRGSSRRSLTRYRTIWKHLIECARQHTLGETFSETLAARFVDTYRVRAGELAPPQEQWRRPIGVGLHMLGDWAHQGRRARLGAARHKALRAYAPYGKERRYLQPATLRRRLTALTVFVACWPARHIQTLEQMQAGHVSAFVRSRDHLPPRTVARIITDVRSFLRLLLLRGIVQTALRGALPTVRVPRDAHIPSVWAPELLVKLLEVLDRSAAQGTRADAMILLACRLGWRAGDMRALQLDDLHGADATLELSQAKTHRPLLLPLTEEVGAARIDSWRAGRPTTPSRESLLTLTSPAAPFRPTNRYHMIAYWRHLAGSTVPTAQRQGLHAFHTSGRTSRQRITVVRQFATFLCRLGYPA